APRCRGVRASDCSACAPPSARILTAGHTAGEATEAPDSMGHFGGGRAGRTGARGPRLSCQGALKIVPRAGKDVENTRPWAGQRGRTRVAVLARLAIAHDFLALVSRYLPHRSSQTFKRQTAILLRSNAALNGPPARCSAALVAFAKRQ